MSNETKERILKTALEILSRDGYAGANLKGIAAAVRSLLYLPSGSKKADWIDRGKSKQYC